MSWLSNINRKRVCVIHAPIRRRYVVKVKDGFFSDWEAVGWYNYTPYASEVTDECFTKAEAYDKAVGYAMEIAASEVVWEG